MPSLPRATSLIQNAGEATVVFGNIEGLYPRKNKHKVTMLSELGKNNNTIVFALTESHLRQEIRDAEIYMPGFQIYRADRQEGIKKGGVIVYLRDDFATDGNVLTSGSNGVVEWLVLHLVAKNLIIITIYRPPTCPNNLFTQIIHDINNQIEAMGTPSPTIIMSGDFNLPIIEWPSGEIRGGHAYMRVQAQVLLEFSNNHMMEQCILEPTRGHNILDLFFANDHELVTGSTVSDTIISDHRIVIVETILLCGTLNERRAPSRNNEMSSLNFFNKNVNWELINSMLFSVDWVSELEGDPAHVIYDKIHQKLWDICSEMVPQRKSPKSKGIIPRDRKVLMRKRTRLNKRIKNTSSELTKQRLVNEVLLVEESLKESHKRERRGEEEYAVSAIKENPKYFFSYARQKSLVNMPVGPLTVLGSSYTKPEDLTRIMAEQFMSVFSSPMFSNEENELGVLMELGNSESNLIDIEFTENDIIKSIDKLSVNSAAGPDGIPAILLKKCAGTLSLPLKILWKSSMNTVSIPDEMKLGLITPVYKGGSRSEPANYRPITLTSHIVKTFERIVVEKLVLYMEESNLFNESQHGFRRGRSCLSQLIQHHSHLIEVLEERSSADVVYLDFAKAFDKVDHGVLLRKLKESWCGRKVA